ncbi:MAG: SRPBCC domain-containing protein [Deltaproteobacteria bacterium]
MTKLTLTTEDDTKVVVTRRFAAPPERVFDAHTTPDLLQKWCLGPDGWTMPVCICNAVPGGAMRYEWSNGEGGFHLTGEFVDVERPSRIVHIERMHLPDPTPDNRVETLFKDDGAGGTLMVMTMTLPDAATREQMLATGMEHGMEASYARLESLL